MQLQPRELLLLAGLTMVLGATLVVFTYPSSTWSLVADPGLASAPLPAGAGILPVGLILGSRKVDGPFRTSAGAPSPAASPSAEASPLEPALLGTASQPQDGPASATLAAEEAAGSIQGGTSTEIGSSTSSGGSGSTAASDTSGSSTPENPSPGSSGDTEAESGKDRPPLEVNPWDPNFRSQMRQDRWLLGQLFSGRDQHLQQGFFVEFGARNGEEHSNTYFFEKTFGWRGILAEASDKEWGNIGETRSGSAVIKGAFCANEGPATFGNVGIGLGGFPATYDPQRKEVYNLPPLEVQCYRLDKVLDQFGVKAIDYMSVDTEGSELDALSSFPFGRIPARIIGIEVLIGPGREGRVEKTIEFMDQRGYQLRHKYTVADDTLDIFFEPKEFDPQVFYQPRVDVAAFTEARRVCREETKICL